MYLQFMCLINIYFIKQLKENSFDKLFQKFTPFNISNADFYIVKNI